MNILGYHVHPGVVAATCFIAVVAAGLLLKRIAYAVLTRWAKRTAWRFDDVFFAAASRPIDIMVVVGGGALAYEVAFGAGKSGEVSQYTAAALKIATSAAIILFADRLLVGILRMYANKHDVLRYSLNLLTGILHVIIFSIGILVVLDSLGISVTPIVASLGIGSLAVALALQPTLENWFSGLQVILDRPILPGHFIKLESGEEGFVDKIGWRSTWLKQLSNNMVIIPNKVILNSRITNYNYPSPDQAVLVDVGVHYRSDLAAVERIVSDVGKEVMRTVTGGVPEFEPFIRYNEFDDFSVNFTTILRGQQFTDNYLIKHEFIKAITERFNREGIVMPFPITALNTEQEKATIGASNGHDRNAPKEAHDAEIRAT